MFKKLFPSAHSHYKAYRKLIKNQKSYLHATGWMHSLKELKPMDATGAPLPWMNFSVISILNEKLTKDLNVFEFGSGYSTQYYASRVNRVTSVEYDPNWFEIVKENAPQNVRLIYQAQDVDGDYCRAVRAENEKYDLVIVDGRDRVNCVKQSLTTLSPQGVILLDDSQRERYKAAFDFATSEGFKQLNIEGLKTTGKGVSKTSIFYRRDNSLGI